MDTASAAIHSALHIAIFCKPLIPGAVKTRLILAFGAEGAASIYAQLVDRTLTTVRHAQGVLDASASLWVAGDALHPSIIDWSTRFALPTFRQCDGDLGEKMFHCLDTMTATHERVLLIGTDCPAFTADVFANAARSLTRECPWVFTPAEDGGYVLVGSAAPSMHAFDDIAWSTSGVMVQTRAALTAHGLAWAETPMLWDVDVALDVARARDLRLLDQGS